MRPLFHLIAQHAVNPERVEQLVAELHPATFLEDTFAAQIVRGTLRLDDENRTDADRALLTAVIRRAMSELRKLQTDRHLKAEFQLDLPGLISAKDVLRFRRQAAKQEKAEKRKNEPISEPVGTAQVTLNARIHKEQEQILKDLKKRTHSGTRDLSRGHTSTAESENLKKQTHFAGGSSSLSKEAAFSGPNSGQRSHLTPRNAPCPCKSGEKYKRCCGKDAPPVYTQAA